MHASGPSPYSPYHRLLWVVVAVLLVGNQAAFRIGVPAATARAVATCHCPPGHCMCGHAHRPTPRCCAPTGGACHCLVAPTRHDPAGLVHADWPPTLLAVATPPVAPPLDRRATMAGTIFTGWCDPPPLPPPQVG